MGYARVSGSGERALRTTEGFLAALAMVLALVSLAACGGGDPEELSFNLEIEERSLSEEDATVEVRQDDRLTIVLTSDELVNYHLHGYDLQGDVGPGMPATLEFDAYATGSFPITIHVPASSTMADDTTPAGGHSGTLQAPQDMTVSVDAQTDPVSGVNVRIDTTGFDFAPENVNGHHVEGEGHAHIYVDGVKTSRMYGPFFYLDHIELGERVIRVTLNANTHEAYAKGSDAVEAIADVTVASGGGDHHGPRTNGGDGMAMDPNATVPAPEGMAVRIVATPDQVSGVNIELVTIGFTFAPENVNGDHVEGEGHAHIYVDGEKFTRLYGPFFHLDNIGHGERTISVILNSNTHQEYAIGDEVLAASTTVMVESAGDGGHGHDDQGSGGADRAEEIELGRLVVQPR